MPFRAIGSDEDVSCPESFRTIFSSPAPPTPRVPPTSMGSSNGPNGPNGPYRDNPQNTFTDPNPKQKGRAVIPDGDSRLDTILKRCVTCKEIQPLKSFAKHDTSRDGRASICNRCRNKRNTNRRQTNPTARLKHLLVARILRNHPNIPELTKNLEVYLGYKVQHLREKLDVQCEEDYGMPLLKCIASGDYHIDHRMPLSHFKIEEPGDEQFRTCWHPDNLKVITAEENRAKGATVEEGFDISELQTLTPNPNSKP